MEEWGAEMLKWEGTGGRGGGFGGWSGEQVAELGTGEKETEIERTSPGRSTQNGKGRNARDVFVLNFFFDVFWALRRA